MVERGRTNSRGPERDPDSYRKRRCCYKGCRRKQVEVKNVGKHLRLPKQEVNLEMCRKVRAHCNSFTFCCPERMEKCKYANPKKKSQEWDGGRAPLDPSQLLALFRVMLTEEPWSAVCACRCKWSWISGHYPNSGRRPMIRALLATTVFCSAVSSVAEKVASRLTEGRNQDDPRRWERGSRREEEGGRSFFCRDHSHFLKGIKLDADLYGYFSGIFDIPFIFCLFKVLVCFLPWQIAIC